MMKYISLIVLFLLPVFIVEGAPSLPVPPQNKIDEFNKNYDRYEQELQEQQRLLKQKAIEKEPNKIETYDENIDEIRTGSIYGAGSGVVLFGGVVAAPFIASAATTAYYATGVTFYAATQAVNNYSSSLVNKAEDVYYKLGIQYMSETPNIVNVSYKVGDFFRGFNPEAAGAPDTEWSQIGGLARGLFDEIKSLNDDLVKIESNLKYKVVDNDY